MIRSIKILLPLLLFSIISKGQQPESSDYIEWREAYKLRWEDFQAPQSQERFGDAGTAVLIQAKPFRKSKELHYDVFVFFDKKESWCTEKSDHLLAHEQLHFDIAEVYARKIRKKIVEMLSQNINDYVIINEAIQQILEESNQADKLYDTETLHGAITEQQTAWVAKIQEELLTLVAYRKTLAYLSKY